MWLYSLLFIYFMYGEINIIDGIDIAFLDILSYTATTLSYISTYIKATLQLHCNHIKLHYNYNTATSCTLTCIVYIMQTPKLYYVHKYGSHTSIRSK